MAEDRNEPPFEGGAQRVVEKRAEVPGAGRSAGQIIVGLLTLLVLIAGLLWIIVPFGD